MNPPAARTCIQPYLFFSGRCEEALHFYQSAIGATLGMVMPPCFGMVQDKFGMGWMITVPEA